MDEFECKYRRALQAEAHVRAVYERELPHGESVTLDTLGDSLAGLTAFLKRMGFLVEVGARRMAAAPPDPEAARRNTELITEPLRTATAKYQSAQHIISNLTGENCILPLETVRELGIAIGEANELASRL